MNNGVVVVSDTGGAVPAAGLGVGTGGGAGRSARLAQYQQEAAALDTEITACQAQLAAWQQRLAQAATRREQVRGALEALGE